MADSPPARRPSETPHPLAGGGRARVEEALRASEERHRILAQNSPLGIWQVTPAGDTLYANPAMCRLLEVEGADALAGRTYTEFFAPESLEVMDRERARRERGESSSYEVELVGARGGRRRVMIWGGPILDREGRLESLVGTFHDVTEQRRVDEERRRLDAQLQQTQRLESLGVLAGGIAHDFNNILTGVLGNASLALLKLDAASPVRPLIERIERSAQRAAELTTQMLAYAGKGRFRLEGMELPRVVAEMETLLHSSISKKATLVLRLGAESCPVEADPAQMRQVVMNLVSNASDAIGESNGSIHVAAGCTEIGTACDAAAALGDPLPAGRYAFLEVSDTGLGMDDATQARMFEPFFTTKQAGRGLGLPAVLGIVRGHRGAVRVTSRPGAGTTVRVLLPVARRALAPTSRDACATPVPRVPTVLVVDDEEVVRAVSKMALEDAGFRVLAAADGLEGIEAVRREGAGIDLVLLDLTMPRMGGEEALKGMRTLRPDLPVILCSGYSEQEVSDSVDAGGVAGFLQKPFRAGDLVRRVKECLPGSPKPAPR